MRRGSRSCRAILAAWLGLLVALGVTGAAAAAGAPAFDGRGWIVGSQQQNARQRLTEYVLPGQTVDNWREMVTSTVFFQPVPLAAFLQRLRASLAQGCPSLVWTVLQQDERTAVFEWRDAGCGGFEPQYELDRVTIDPSGLYRLAYAAKGTGAIPPERRAEWLAILRRVPLAEGGPSAPAVTGPAGPSTPAGSAPPAKPLSAEELAAGVRRSGWLCPAGVKAEAKGQLAGPQGPLATWRLECSNGQHYTVLVDPSGSMTSFQTPD